MPEAALDGAVTALRHARPDTRKAAETGAARVVGERAWLEAVLQGLAEGVFVCTRQHRIMLNNHAAVELTGAPDKVGLGRPLGEVVAEEAEGGRRDPEARGGGVALPVQLAGRAAGRGDAAGGAAP